MRRLKLSAIPIFQGFAAWLGLLSADAPYAERGQFDQFALPAIPDAEAIVDLHGGDLDGDGFGDLFVTAGFVTVGNEGQQVAVRDWILWGGANGPSLGTVPLDSGSPQVGVAAEFADFDRDGDLDIVVAGGALYLGGGVMQDQPSVLYANLGNRQFSNAIPLGSINRSAGIAVLDWSNDGASDVVLSHADGTLSIFQNMSSTPGSFSFEHVQTLSVGGLDAQHARVSAIRLDADNRLDLVVLRSQSLPFFPLAGVAYYRNTGSSPAFTLAHNYALPLGTPNDLAVGDFDGNGLDDVALAASMPISAVNPPPDELRQSASRLLLSFAGVVPLIVESPARFPPLQDQRVEVADFNDDQAPDLLMIHNPCPPYQWLQSSCPEPDYAAMTVWLQTDGSFQTNRQFLGSTLGANAISEITDLTGDGLVDMVVIGPARSADATAAEHLRASRGAVQSATAFPNNPPLRGWEQCLAQWFFMLRDSATRSEASAGDSLRYPIDLGAYSRVRDQLMPASNSGARLHARYNAFSSEIIDLAMAHPALALAAGSTLSQWSQPVRALLNGDGQAYTVNQDMIDAVNSSLLLMSQHGSIALQEVIADERSRLPPLQSLVGLDMDAFLAITLPNSRLFSDGFED